MHFRLDLHSAGISGLFRALPLQLNRSNQMTAGKKKCPALRDALHVPVFGWVSFDDPLLRHRTIPCQLRLIKCNKFPSLIPCELFPKFPSHLLPKIASRCRVMPGQTQKNQLPPVMVVVPWGTAWQSRPWSDHRRSRRPCSRS